MSHSRDGKSLALEAKFCYEQESPRQEGTLQIKQRAVLRAIISEEIIYMGQSAAARTVYAAMRPPCPLSLPIGSKTTYSY